MPVDPSYSKKQKSLMLGCIMMKTDMEMSRSLRLYVPEEKNQCA